GPAAAAFREIELWRPFLSRFPDGVEKFAHWVFWPSTILRAPAPHELTRVVANDAQLAELIGRSQIWASEEVIFPTLVALLGYEVARSPCSYAYGKQRVEYTRPEIERALDDAASFWIHPVPRRYNDPLRAHVRTHFGNYDRQRRLGARLASGRLAPADGSGAGLGAIRDR